MTKLKTALTMAVINSENVVSRYISFVPNRVTTSNVVYYDSLQDNVTTGTLVYYDSTCLHPRITNCKNCGAPLHGDHCEYCGTEY